MTLTAAREGWPVVGQIVKLVVRDEIAQRDRFMRENLDAMASKVGEMQAKLVQLEALGERVSGLAGVTPPEIKLPPGRGGALVSGRPLSMEELQAALTDLDQLAVVPLDAQAAGQRYGRRGNLHCGLGSDPNVHALIIAAR